MATAAPSGLLYACFWIGVGVLAAGVVLGIALSFAPPASAAPAQKAKDAKEKLKAAKAKLQTLGAEAAAAAKADPSAAPAAEKAAKKSGAEIDNLMKDAESLISALPEPLRFSGLLVLIGAALMSVAAVQLGGHSIF